MNTSNNRGFVHMHVGDLVTQYAPEYDKLGPDIYHPASQGGRTRHLAQHYVRFDAATGKTSTRRLPTEPFIQGDTNQLTGHIPRPIDSPRSDLSFDELFKLAFNIFNYHWKLADLEAEWNVNCHLIRTHASRQHIGVPVPEGLHRDGVEFLVMGCVDYQGISGGKTVITECKDATPVFERVLIPGDLVLLNDRVVFHTATPIQACGRYGYRDMLIIGFHVWSKGHYRGDYWERSRIGYQDLER